VIKQANGNDCGVYAIHFMRLWLQDADALMDVIQVITFSFVRLSSFSPSKSRDVDLTSTLRGFGNVLEFRVYEKVCMQRS
jgi:Ulp1 family protease